MSKGLSTDPRKKQHPPVDVRPKLDIPLNTVKKKSPRRPSDRVFLLVAPVMPGLKFTNASSGGVGYSAGGPAVTMVFNFDRLFARANDIERKQLPFATARALTWTAKAAQADMRAAMGKVFDSPIGYTLRGVTIEPATKDRLRATVLLNGYAPGKLPVGAYLYPQVFGGKRGQKAFERALSKAGLLPAGWVTVPAAGAKLNAAGNITAGQIVQMLSDLKLQFDATANRSKRSLKRNKSYRKQRFFVPAKGSHLKPGVWIRDGKGGIKPMVLFVQQQTYAPRLDYFGIVRESATRNFPELWTKSFGQAMASARR
ncbi:hypothetical protein FJ973_05935 [Mesorhizobium sp. B2-1-3]|uniref:hypothetical protein n=1 Tax=Mesorhizobium sp. B2-1-3 TaxID=2589972 RepID=UPI00112ACBE8|nr:hypothetical protein [Mesorhizobium sp. B2-1-3]TPN16230.1 hypothetical protein FJ973_05935 [Mesorhizobium sp. B2-1-3]